MNITVTHTLAPEILTLLQGFTSNGNGGSALAVTNKEKKSPVIKTDIKDDAIISNTKNTDEVTIEQIRAAVQAKKDTKREAIKALLTKFDVAKVTELDKAKYSEFLTEINAL